MVTTGGAAHQVLHPLLDIHLVWAVGPAFPAEAATISPKSLVDRPIFTNPMPAETEP